MNTKRFGFAVAGLAVIACMGAASPALAGGFGRQVTYYTPARTVYVQQPVTTQTVYYANGSYVSYPLVTTQSTCVPRYRSNTVHIGVTNNWDCNRNYTVRRSDCGRSLRKVRACNSWNLRSDCGTRRFRHHRW